MQLPGGELHIRQPRESAELPDEGEIKWAPVVAYWSVLWRSGLALAQEVEETAAVAGRTVVELGCGMGLPSLAAARAGAEALATDTEPEALELLARNAEANGLTVETAVVDWYFADDLLARGPFDLALASDILYLPSASDTMLELLPSLAREVWIADPGRSDAEVFLERAAERWSIATTRRGVARIHRLRRR